MEARRQSGRQQRSDDLQPYEAVFSCFLSLQPCFQRRPISPPSCFTTSNTGTPHQRPSYDWQIPALECLALGFGFQGCTAGVSWQGHLFLRGRHDRYAFRHAKEGQLESRVLGKMLHRQVHVSLQGRTDPASESGWMTCTYFRGREPLHITRQWAVGSAVLSARTKGEKVEGFPS